MQEDGEDGAGGEGAADGRCSARLLVLANGARLLALALPAAAPPPLRARGTLAQRAAARAERRRQVRRPAGRGGRSVGSGFIFF